MSLKKFFQSNLIEAGCDESGRGCLAGPVFAAAVVLDPNNSISGLNDSKKLSSGERLLLKNEIELKARSWAVAYCTAEEIDKLNILQASFLAMHKAISMLSVQPELLLIDGNRFKPYQSIQHHCIVKGDALYESIAAASILAKTHRDEYMLKQHVLYPDYGWDKNKGYPTKMHRRVIAKLGITPLHRKSFTLLPAQLKLL